MGMSFLPSLTGDWRAGGIPEHMISIQDDDIIGILTENDDALLRWRATFERCVDLRLGLA